MAFYQNFGHKALKIKVSRCNFYWRPLSGHSRFGMLEKKQTLLVFMWAIHSDWI